MTDSTSPNPAVGALGSRSTGGAGAVVIFGASGDLTRRKLVPALYNLVVDGLLPAEFAVVGVGRREMSDEKFAESLREGIESFSRRSLNDERWSQLASRISYAVADPREPGSFDRLSEHLEAVDRKHGTRGNRLYYLSTPPSAYPAIIEALGESGLNRAPGPDGWARIVLEKPIGRDLETAEALNRCVNAVFDERHVYRIDHYLGKETVQNLLVFRFANAIFEPLWNQKYMDHVQITVGETIGVEGRGSYFEEAGIARDMVQNHLFQLLCLLAMEPPVSLAPDAIRDEKVKVLQALRPVPPDEVRKTAVRGQYSDGTIGGERVDGYLQEPGVARDSRTETFVAAKLLIDNWRWADVPFYLRAGKRMARRLTEIALQFRDVPHRLFPSETLVANTLLLRIQPDEGITLRFDAKVPGTAPRILPVSMDFLYGTSFGQAPPEAYERLLLDAIHGDSTLFIRRDEVEASWAYIDRLHEGWRREDPGNPLPDYTSGTWGPAESHVMLARDGRTWRRPHETKK